MKPLNYFFLGVILMMMSQSGMAESPLLEALGLSQDTRALVIHADDVGMCWAEHDASIRAMEKGSVTCGSAMVPCSWFPATARACKKNPDLDMGIHLTLTSEWGVYRWGPLAGRDRVPLLVDDEGYLWHEVPQVYRSVGSHIDQVITEVQAQIDLYRKQGLEPSHLDSHMGTLFYNEAYFKATCNVALKNDIPFMVFNYSDQVAEEVGRKLPYYDKSLVRKLAAAGFPLFDAFYGEELVDEDYDKGFDNYCERLSNLKPGVSMMILHMGVDSPELKNVTARHAARDQQFRIFSDPKMADFIKEQGIRLLNWRDVRKAVWDKRDKTVTKVFD